MKTFALAVALLFCVAGTAPAAAQITAPAGSTDMGEQKLLQLSRQKWVWMAERNVDALDDRFHPKAKFVHMGATMSKAQELDVIRTGRIQYKKADIENSSVEVIGDTAILLNKVRLLAVVGGSEVTNPFVVTEVYVRDSGLWKLGSVSFTRLLGN